MLNTNPFANNVPEGRRRSPSKFVRVLFNEACNDRLQSLALENYNEWINASDEDDDMLSRIAIHKAIRERGGIDKATACRVIIVTEEAMRTALADTKYVVNAAVIDYLAQPESGNA